MVPSKPFRALPVDPSACSSQLGVGFPDELGLYAYLH